MIGYNTHMSKEEREALYFNIEWHAAQIGWTKRVRPIDEYSDWELQYIESYLRDKDKWESQAIECHLNNKYGKATNDAQG